MDFGLIDPDGVFRYVSTEDGTFDTIFEIPERANYRLGIKNNSGKTVDVSGFVKYRGREKESEKEVFSVLREAEFNYVIFEIYDWSIT